MYRKFISEAGIETLKRHAYKSSEYTYVDKLIDPYWKLMADKLPNWLAPNMITLIAFIFLASGCFVCLLTPDRFNKYRLNFSMFYCALAGLIYQTLDALDGKQARRLGLSSPLGQLFDHGCDCIGTTFWLYMLIVALDSSQNRLNTFLGIIASFFFFYMATFAEYFTHVLVTSKHNFGVTETQFLLIALFLFSGIFGSRIFSTKIYVNKKCEIQLSHLIFSVGCIIAIFLGFLILYDGYKKSADSFLFFKMLIPIFSLIILTALLFLSRIGYYPKLIFFLSMFAFNAITIKIIICSITQMPYPLFNIELIPLVFLLFFSWSGFAYKQERIVAEICVCFNMLFLSFLGVNIARQIARELNISIFTVKTHI